ncbi:MAG: DUF2267 domain-containing protein [Chloroflexota bacterium]
MQHDEFVGQVQHRAQLSALGDAERATRALLETLAERLDGGEAKDLAAQLPREIGLHLTRDEKRAWESERLSLDEFYQRVSERESVDLPVAIFHARAVMSVVEEAVSAGEMSDVRQQLGEEFAPLFEFENIPS